MPFASPASRASLICSSIDSVMTAFEGFAVSRFTCDRVLTACAIASVLIAFAIIENSQIYWDDVNIIPRTQEKKIKSKKSKKKSTSTQPAF
jgi:hypothetical protein